MQRLNAVIVKNLFVHFNTNFEGFTNSFVDAVSDRSDSVYARNFIVNTQTPIIEQQTNDLKIKYEIF